MKTSNLTKLDSKFAAILPTLTKMELGQSWPLHVPRKIQTPGWVMVSVPWLQRRLEWLPGIFNFYKVRGSLQKTIHMCHGQKKTVRCPYIWTSRPLLSPTDSLSYCLSTQIQSSWFEIPEGWLLKDVKLSVNQIGRHCDIWKKCWNGSQGIIIQNVSHISCEHFHNLFKLLGLQKHPQKGPVPKTLDF